MSILVTDYCKYGDINEFISEHHRDKARYLGYRKRWGDNKGDLLFLLLETVSACNLKCPMCVHSVGHYQIKPMDDDIFERSLAGIREMNIPSVGMNQANEPLLDKEIFERTEAVARTGCVMDIHMNTNAVLLDEETSLKILESSVTRLLIGFDGFSKKTYEDIRRGADYEKVLCNILRFLELKDKIKKKLPVVRVSFVRTSVNEHEVEGWFDFWKNRADYITIQEYLTQVSDESKNSLRARNNKRKMIDPSRITCRQPFERAIVRGNGDVILCCAPFATKMPVGNIREKSLKEIWHGRNAADLRNCFLKNEWTKHPICSKCLGISYEVELSQLSKK